MAVSLKDGVDKYDRGNWRKGFPQDEMIDSLLRHVLALKRGEVVDPDSKNGATHYDSIVANALMLSELRPVPTLDVIDATHEDEEVMLVVRGDRRQCPYKHPSGSRCPHCQDWPHYLHVQPS